MKKTVLITTAVLGVLTLTACSNSKSSGSNNPQPSAANVKIAKDLRRDFNTDDQKVVKVKVDPSVVDDQSKTDSKGNQKPHQDIKVTVTDKSTINAIKQDKTAIDGGTATTDQEMYISGIQEQVSKEAKKLKNSTDTISFGYDEDSDNNVLIAKSQKDKDIIKQTTVQ